MRTEISKDPPGFRRRCCVPAATDQLSPFKLNDGDVDGHPQHASQAVASQIKSIIILVDTRVTITAIFTTTEHCIVADAGTQTTEKASRSHSG